MLKSFKNLIFALKWFSFELFKFLKYLLLAQLTTYIYLLLRKMSIYIYIGEMFDILFIIIHAYLHNQYK